MIKRLVFLNKLRPGVKASEYEEFLRNYDYPKTMEVLPVSYYRAVRLESRLLSTGDLPYSYAEIIDIDDFDTYKRAFSAPTAAQSELFKRVFEFIDDQKYLDLYGTIVE